jgi:hypothetical protein
MAAAATNRVKILRTIFVDLIIQQSNDYTKGKFRT